MTGFFEEFERQLRSAAEQRAGSGHAAVWWRRRRNVGLLAVLALGVATPALAQVTGLWDPGIKSSPARTTTVPSPQVAACPSTARAAQTQHRRHLDPGFREQLSVLRRPQGRGDSLPDAGALRALGQTVLPGTVRYLGSVAGGRYFVAAVVSPARGGPCEAGRLSAHIDLCLVRATGGGSCGTPATDFRRRGIRASHGLAAHQSVVVALVPDAVRSVSVRYGRSERSFDVHDNFYGYRVSVGAERPPDAIVWTMRNGTRRTLP